MLSEVGDEDSGSTHIVLLIIYVCIINLYSPSSHLDLGKLFVR